VKIAFQASLYPVGRPDFKTPIDAFIARLRSSGVTARVHETCTIGEGGLDEVLDAVRRAYAEAAAGGDAVLVLTLASGAPTAAELDRLNPR
jgi:uncharacterized protein YqgV (UPF0045/DUF77 family)